MRKVLLCIMDGVGISEEKNGNAFFNANTPNLDKLMKKYNYQKIEASGKYVGLPNLQIGNSEVGHLTIGSGRIINQPLTRINQSIDDKSFYNMKELEIAILHAKKNNSKLHIMGMLSDGGVHSHIKHIFSILEICKRNNFNNVYFHVFTDGRDTYYKSAIKYLNILQEKIDEFKIGSIATICGRYYAMDRDKRWDRLKKAYDSIVNNIGEKFETYEELINSNYKREIFDEFIIPGILDENGSLESNDSVIWANFRPERARELLSSFVDKKFEAFECKDLKNLNLTTFMWVSDNVKSNIVFKAENIENTLGVYLSDLGLKQLRIAETEKYAHVTYFFDGLKDLNLENCKKILIPSLKVSTYDLEPKMSAKKITDTLLDEMENNYDFILMNFANGDMVGHTGNYNATVKAIEEMDNMIGRIYKKSLLNDYLLIITADHGNCEMMLDENDRIVTRHTNNKVPFIVCDETVKSSVKSLCEIAPFIINIMGEKIPNEMK